MIRYTLSPTPEQVDAGGRIVETSGQLKKPLNLEKFRKSCVISAALNPDGEVVGIGTIKKRRGTVAESGFVAVRDDYRRQGIAARLSKLRIEEARRIGIQLLWARTKPHNKGAIASALQANFERFGQFKKPNDLLGEALDVSAVDVSGDAAIQD